MEARDGFERPVMRLTTADTNIVQTLNERLREQTKWNEALYDKLNEAFRARVVETLDRHDAIRAEIIERLEQIVTPSRPQQSSAPTGGQHRTSALEPVKICTNVPAAMPQAKDANLILGEAENFSAVGTIAEGTEAIPAISQELCIEVRDECAAVDPQLFRVHEDIEFVVKEVRQLVSRAESASREALEACASSDRQLEGALAALRQAGEEATRVANDCNDAQRQRAAAMESYNLARQELATAGEALKTSTSQLEDAKSSAEAVLDSIRNAENETNKAITLAMGAGTKAQLAEEELRKSQHLMRRTRGWALVTLLASLSIGTWETIRAAESFHYTNGMPVVVTVIAVVVGLVVWKTERT